MAALVSLFTPKAFIELQLRRVSQKLGGCALRRKLAIFRLPLNQLHAFTGIHVEPFLH